MNRYAAFAEPWRQHEMSMDLRHAEAIGRFIRHLQSPARVVEVGCCYGVSTAEVLAACEESGAVALLIDVAFTESVKRMVTESVDRVSVGMTCDHSAACLGRCADGESVVILDGDHRRSYMELEDEILSDVRPRAIVLHDITSHRLDCDGPRWFMHKWQAMRYFLTVDCLPREGERTDRGIAFLCRSTEDAFAARFACAGC